MNRGTDQIGSSQAYRENGNAAGVRMDEERLERIIAALRTVFDPELPVNIFDLGLIYAIDAVGDSEVAIRMTLTAPGCPVAGTLPRMVEQAVETVEGVNRCRVTLVWDPPWRKDMMSEEAQLELGMM